MRNMASMRGWKPGLCVPGWQLLGREVVGASELGNGRALDPTQTIRHKSNKPNGMQGMTQMKMKRAPG